MKFRKKPVVIEAVQWCGNNLKEITTFLGYEPRSKTDKYYRKLLLPEVLMIETLESPHEATEGDWVIKGIKGEFYPCKPDIFEATYERVE
jgi:hypothetical protein